MSETQRPLTEEEKKAKRKAMLETPHPHSHIKNIIGVISGKGGVGKSIVTALLASEIRQKGYKVGIIDADITGPSIPQGFNIHERMGARDGAWIPEDSKTGIRIVSINLMLEHETDPVLWRGPLISNMVKKFYTDVVWNEIDVLLVDFPPGTGDVAITCFQAMPLSGVVVVTSPQDLVSMIVSKAVHMADKMQIPILGIVENMSYFTCPDCQKSYHIFGESKIEDIALEHGVDVLGKLPIDPALASAYDHGAIEDTICPKMTDIADELLKKLSLDHHVEG
jgi:Mrp family chromosome partitioning ATPase